MIFAYSVLLRLASEAAEVLRSYRKELIDALMLFSSYQIVCESA